MIACRFDNFDALAIATSPQYVVAYEEASFRVFQLVVRGLLILTSLFCILWWFWSHCGTPLNKWLPQRHWVTLLLFSILGWQNPLLLISEIITNVRVHVLPRPSPRVCRA